MSDFQTLALLIALMFAAVVTIHWAWVTRAADGPYVNDFVMPVKSARTSPRP